MRRIHESTLAATPARLVVRRAWWAYLPLLVFLALGCAFWAALAWHAAGIPILRSVLVLLAAFVLALVLLVAQRTVRMLGNSNWLLRITDEALILNPIDAQGRTDGELVEVPFGEIVSARRVVEKRLGVGDHTIEDVHETHVYLELGLADVDSSPLARFRPPITLQSPRTLRIGWRDRATRLTPSLATFMHALPVTIAREPEARVEWPESPTLSDDEFRERVRALCAGNDKLGAIKVVRVRYKLGLRQAKELVEHLSAS
jgi:hypothetical protein